MNIFRKLMYVAILLLAFYTGNAQVSKQQVSITNFTAGEKANKLCINWTTDGAVPTNYFEVQRSDDGNTFKTIALVLGADPQQTDNSYMYAEKNTTHSGKPVYFRLCHIDTNGVTQLSKIIQL